MTQFEQFENEPMQCAVCEAMCPEAVDGTLTEAEQRAFDKHVAGCVTCAQELEEAQRGAAWMAMLKGFAPEPPAALLQRILAETTGAHAVAMASEPAAPEFVPEWQMSTPLVPVKATRGFSVQWASFCSKLSSAFSMDAARMTFQPRLAMTAAMAFFSIALTLNLTGVRLSDVRAGILRPTSLRRTLADAGASATRSFQNLRVVYEVESRVSDLRNNGGLDGRFEGTQQDPTSPFVGGPANDANKKQDSGNKDGAATPDSKPEPAKPQGKSDLEYPVMPGQTAGKGVYRD